MDDLDVHSRSKAKGKLKLVKSFCCRDDWKKSCKYGEYGSFEYLLFLFIQIEQRFNFLYERICVFLHMCLRQNGRTNIYSAFFVVVEFFGVVLAKEQ